jgi:hypothetical protein
VVPTAVPRRDGEGRADGAVVKAGADDMVPGCFDVEEERGTGVEEERGTIV